MFISDPELQKTYDPDRQIELIWGNKSSGSSMYRSYKIVGPDFEWDFYAYLTSDHEGGLSNADSKSPVFTFVVNIGVGKTEEGLKKAKIIAESLKSYKIFFGRGRANALYQVYFEGDKAYV